MTGHKVGHKVNHLISRDLLANLKKSSFFLYHSNIHTTLKKHAKAEYQDDTHYFISFELLYIKEFLSLLVCGTGVSSSLININMIKGQEKLEPSQQRQ